EAVKQFTLGMNISSRKDIFLLHQLTLAHLQANNWGLAMEVFQQIDNLNPKLKEENPEIAGLNGRLYREKYEREKNKHDLLIARDAYWIAMEKNPSSYFMADMAGQLCLLLGEEGKAREAYERAIQIIEEMEQTRRDIWSLATLATAFYVVGKPQTRQQRCLEQLQEVAYRRPTARQLSTIEGGLKRLQDGLNVPETIYNEWIKTLRGE